MDMDGVPVNSPRSTVEYRVVTMSKTGKPSSIAWLAHHPQSPHDADDNPAFDTVVILIDDLNEAFGAEWTEADRIIKACADKICEDEEFVAKARTNSMGELLMLIEKDHREDKVTLALNGRAARALRKVPA